MNFNVHTTISRPRQAKERLLHRRVNAPLSSSPIDIVVRFLERGESSLLFGWSKHCLEIDKHVVSIRHGGRERLRPGYRCLDTTSLGLDPTTMRWSFVVLRAGSVHGSLALGRSSIVKPHDPKKGRSLL